MSRGKQGNPSVIRRADMGNPITEAVERAIKRMQGGFRPSAEGRNPPCLHISGSPSVPYYPSTLVNPPSMASTAPVV